MYTLNFLKKYIKSHPIKGVTLQRCNPKIKGETQRFYLNKILFE